MIWDQRLDLDMSLGLDQAPQASSLRVADDTAPQPSRVRNFELPFHIPHPFSLS